MIQHICDRCGGTMKEWKVASLSDTLSPSVPLYDTNRDALRFPLSGQRELCLSCQEDYARWLNTINKAR